MDIGESRSRSASVSSTSSGNSTGTVCENENEIVPFGLGIRPKSSKSTTSSTRDIIKKSSNNNETASVEGDPEVKSKTRAMYDNVLKVKAIWQNTDDTSIKNERKDEAIPAAKSNDSHSGSLEEASSAKMDNVEEDAQSVSTVSGSGIDFFRKFVQRKGAHCKDCEDQFRRDVLISRLVSDSLNTKASIGKRQSKGSSDVSGHTMSNTPDSRPLSNMSESITTCSVNQSAVVSSLGSNDIEGKARALSSRCKSHQKQLLVNLEDTQSLSSKASGSSISGSGLLFLRNYLKKKKAKSTCSTTDGKDKVDPKDISSFNIIPVPFPPPSDFYGPAFMQDGGPDHSPDNSSDRRLSLCSTVADLLNEDFDCDDSELKNLDWEEWDEPLPEDLSYDDLVSVISESFYGDEIDLSDLCELDLEGRKTVVASDTDIEQPTELQANEAVVVPAFPISQTNELIENLTDALKEDDMKHKYTNPRSKSLMQDIEAELELPPMTPVSDEKDEAVRAISRTISKYMRTGSNSSYSSYCSDIGRQSRQSAHKETNRYSRKSFHDEVERNSRLSMYSPAMSDYLPDLAGSNSDSPLPTRRPLSQLLTYDIPSSSSPQLLPSQSPDLYQPDHFSQTPNVQIQVDVNCGSHSNPPTNSYREVNPGSILARLNAENEVGPFDGNRHAFSVPSCKTSETKAYKSSNRDSLLCITNDSQSPPLSPALFSQSKTKAHVAHIRHSSSNNSADSGCPLLDTDKVASLSPTPSPRTNISMLSSNRNKLANFWEKNVGSSSSETPLIWVPEKEVSVKPIRSFKQQSPAHGFQPFRSSFGSESSLLATTDRLAHFHDVTRKAAARNVKGRKNFHRASVGSDCSDFLDVPGLSPGLDKRRDSLTEYFV